jgi:putative heme-binding domain-containing protein
MKIGIVVLALALLPHPGHAAAPRSRPPTSAADLARGEQLFKVDCAACHGPGGEGDRGPTLAVPRLSRASDWSGLRKLIENGVEGTEMPAARLTPEEIDQVGAWVLKLGQRPRQKVVGDPRRGSALYSGKGGCPLCHAIKGEGGTLGTDLTDVGLRRGTAYLRTALIKPEADLPRSFSPYRGNVHITQNFLAVRARTASGQEVVGVRVNEDTFSIQIRDVSGLIHSFFKSELAALDKEWGQSPMPSYDGVFSAVELDDLVAFLAGLRGDQP